MSLSGLGRLSMEDLAVALLGEPNLRLSDPARGDLRFGRRGSMSVKVPPHPRAGVWYDFEAGVGGGVGALAAHLGVGDGGRPTQAAVRRRPSPGPGTSVRSAGAAGLWGRGEPLDAGLPWPVRSWLEARSLWPPCLPLPGCLRWLPRGTAGVLLAMAAPASEWREAWPALPQCRALQRLPLEPGGQGGLKKSLGPMFGAVMVVGDPGCGDGGVLVCEGVADGLALASRHVDPVVVVFGTAAMEGASANGLADFLAGFEGGVTVWADRDGPSGGVDGRPRRGPAGERAGHRLARAVAARGGFCDVRHAGGGHKDAAEQAAFLGFPDLDLGEYREAAERLRLACPDSPGWEIRRVASVVAAVQRHGGEVVLDDA